MNAHNTETGSEYQPTSPSPRHRGVALILTRSLFHARALVRLARRRPLLACSLALGAGSAVPAVGTIAAVHGLHQAASSASATPLAPVPPPPLPPVEVTVPHHRHLLGLTINPLRGLASWYGSVWNGRTTASGEAYDETKMTAAHKSLPLGTLVRVTNLSSQRSVIVRINDRGSMAANRVIDLSSAAARELGLIDRGLARVKLEVLGKA